MSDRPWQRNDREQGFRDRDDRGRDDRGRDDRPQRTDRPAQAPAWEAEKWIDEGSVHDAARKAVGRPSRPSNRREVGRETVADSVSERLGERVGPRSAPIKAEALRSAQAALDAERYLDARRLIAPLAAELPDIAEVRVVHGLALYRLGRWPTAVTELEAHRQITGSSEHLAVLADCYRALKKYHEVSSIWAEIRDASLSATLVAEGRIVAAGALADQGDLKGALEIMKPAEAVPRRPRDHHIKMWYVLGDLYDRSGAVSRAAEFFRRVQVIAPGFAGVDDRLSALGR